MVSKSMIQTFSFPVKKAEMVEEAVRMAKADGKSFSDFLVSLIEEAVRKKEIGLSNNPIGITYDSLYNPDAEKPLQSDLEQWMPQKQAIERLKKMRFPTEHAKHIAQTFTIYANLRSGIVPR